MKRKHPVIEAIEGRIEQMLQDNGFELVDIRYGGTKRNPVLTIMVDKPGGVTADDCAEMSPRLSLLLDVIDPIPASYQLIVSSPGIERPLTKPEHFRRFAGEQAAIRWRDNAGKPQTVQGVLEAGAEGLVRVTGDGETREFRLEDVEEAHLVCDWEAYTEGTHGASEALGGTDDER